LFTDIKVIILTLSDYPERMDNITNLLIKLSKIGLQYEIYYGVNGKDIKFFSTNDVNIKLLNYNSEIYYYDTTMRINKQLMKIGEIGCSLSHLKIYQKLLDDDIHDKYLIFEDDVELITSLDTLYNTISNIPDDFDFLHIAKSDYYPFVKNQKINDYFYDICKQYFNRTTAYIISKSGATKLLNHTKNLINVPVDDLISNFTINNNDFKFYVPENYLFQERNNNVSIISKINNIIT
jgi:glycosyl transferase family 25